MKLASSAVLCFAVAVASASASASSAVDPVVVLEDLTPHSISATSPLGQRLLSEARSLENNNNNYNNNNLFSNNWIADYSLHFEGCHHVSQWNTEVDGEDDVRISTKRLVKFRLCPTGKCNTNSGCNSGYGGA